MKPRLAKSFFIWGSVASSLLCLVNGWPPVQPAMAGTGPGAPLPGEAVFQAQGCTACHTVKSVGGTIGPDLTRVGGRRDRAWLESQINDPTTHNPSSTMPSFSFLPAQEKTDLLDYLQNLK